MAGQGEEETVAGDPFRLTNWTVKLANRVSCNRTFPGNERLYGKRLARRAIKTLFHHQYILLYFDIVIERSKASSL